MRRFLIPLMMASVALPVAASAKERSLLDGFRERAAESRQEKSSEDRPQRAERAVRADRAVRVERSERPVRIERVERMASEPQVERQQVLEAQPEQRVRRVRRSGGGLVDGFRGIAREQQADNNVEVHRGTDGSFTGIPGRTVERRDRTSDRRHRWSSDWRRDHRYDWRHYRDRNRSLFRLGSYYDPYGWGYRRFSIGFNLWPSYYGSNFWMNDPWHYRLPPAYGPYRWVRYYDDALLVNIYTGQVVDVLHNFFW